MDTAKHAGEVMADGFPDRMKYDLTRPSIDVMYEEGRFLVRRMTKASMATSWTKKARKPKADATVVAGLIKLL